MDRLSSQHIVPEKLLETICSCKCVKYINAQVFAAFSKKRRFLRFAMAVGCA